ncbi:MAG: filamentous hemagglutinin N-terminal domain-containing protein [Alphaproteobacteria bacterium]|nr:filamentous hemagglutinin N-terminal domain-containing protein [Alphaproteobacteria bacterium]
MAVAGPEGGLVVGGSATIETVGVDTTIQQSSDRAIIKWDRFDVAQPESVIFQQPSTGSITVNRIHDTKASQIDGKITANGNIILINQNGMTFGEHARVDVGGLVATTSDLNNDSDFMSGGSVVLNRPGQPEAQIINQGSISVHEAGLAGLVAPHLENHGVIEAHLGKVTLASGDITTVDFAGDGLIQIEVSDAVLKQNIKNGGVIRADGGRVVMTAASGRNIVESLINNEGDILAHTISDKKGNIRIGGNTATLQNTGNVNASGDVANEGGHIDIDGAFVSLGGHIHADGKNGGQIDISARTLSLADKISAQGLEGTGGTITTQVTGNTWETSTSRMTADGLSDGGVIRAVTSSNHTTSGQYSAQGNTGKGGKIDITGGSVKMLSAQIDASGATAGGRIRIGGEYQGGKNLPQDDLPNAKITTLDRGTRLRAEGKGDEANGGNIIVWSDNDTLSLATISATPGLTSGNGGFVELSSSDTLTTDSIIQTGRDARSGTVLLDPKNIIIANATFNPTAIIMGRGVGTGTSGNNVDITSLNYGGEFASYAVSLDGNRMAVGWLNDLGADGLGGRAGAVYLYSFTDAAFSGGVLEGIMGRGYTGGKNVNVPLDNTWDRFGTGVSLDGNRIAIGAFAGDGSTNSCTDCGEVYLYSFSDAAFNGATLQSRIGQGYTGGKNFNMTSLNTSDFFGWSVSLDGNRLAVGARDGDGNGNTLNAAGEVYLFSFADSLFSTPTLQATIGNGYTGGKNINQTLDAVDRFGWSVSLDGNRLAVSARDDDGATNSTTDSGAAYLYSFTDSVFSGGVLEARIGQGYTGGKNLDTSAFANVNDYFFAVSLDGNRLALGIGQDDGNGNTAGNSGAAYLYSFTDSVFSGGTIEARIGNNYAALGGKNLSRPNEAGGSDLFGYSLSLNGNRLVVGAEGDDGSGNVNTNIGAYHFYTFSDAAFTGGTYQGSLGRGYTGGKNINLHFNSASDSPSDRMSVSLSDNRIAIGMPWGDGFNDTLGDSGEVYLYSFANSNFDSAVLEAMIGAGYTGGKNINLSGQLDAADYFGESVSLDGNRLAVGARGDDRNGNSMGDSGAVYLFSFTDSLFSGGVLQSRIGSNYGALGGKNFSVTNIGGSDWFGSGVSLDGSRLAVTAARDDGNANSLGDSGAVYLFTFADSVFTTPTLQGIIGAGYGALGGKNFSITNLGTSDIIGEYGGVSLDGNRLAITARGDDGFGNTRSDAGAAYLFTFADSTFTTPTLQAIMGYGYTGGKNVDMTMLDLSDFLAGVALEGTTLALGASRDDGVGNALGDSGAIHIYNFDDLSFTNGQLDATIGFNYTGGKNINTSSVINSFDFMGAAIDMNNGTLVSALPGLDGGNGSGAENGNVYNGSGGVFIFRGNSNPVTNGNAFATLSSNTIGITPANITALLNTPQNVILQANNDIIVDNDVIANNPSGNAGNLTLQAGRSILVNANITTDNGDLNLWANEDLSAGVVNAQRDAGAATITMATGTTINAGTGNVNIRLEDGTGKTQRTSGNIVLNTITAGTIFARNIEQTSSIILNGALTASGTGTPLTLASGKDFINNFGAGALNTASGRWLVYSDHPILNTLGGITSDFQINNCIYAGVCGAIPGAGNGLLYEYVPNILNISVNTSRLYGDANPDNATLQSLFTYNGFQGADNSSVLDVLPTASVAGSATATAVGGTQHAISLTGGSDNFYTYYLLDPSFLSITARPLTATWVAPLSKIYGDANPTPSYTALNYTGFANSETIGGYNPNFTVDYGSVTTATGVGSYNITPSWSGGGNLLLNYSITPPVGTLNITQRNITASWTGGLSRVYGDTNPTVSSANFNFTGLVNGDLGSVVTPTANYGVITTASNVGTYTGGVSATFSASNYNVTNSPTTNLVINKRNITASVNNKSRAYGDTNPTWVWGDVVWSNLANSETGSVLDSVVFTSPSLAATANVGTTQSIGITSFLDNNYNLTSHTAGTLSINKRDITATIGNKSRTYGDANPTWALGDVVWNNLANSETGSVLDSVVFAAPSLAATVNVGTTESIGITSFLDNNYNLTSHTAGTLSLTKRNVTAVVGSHTQIYGSATPQLTASDLTWTNLVNGDLPSGLDSLTLTSPTLLSTSNAGTSHVVSIASLVDNNYALLTSTNGSVTINKAPLVLTVQDARRPASTPNPNFEYVLSGLKNGENNSVLTGVLISSVADVTSPAGTYAIEASGGTALNYLISTYIPGVLTVDSVNQLPNTYIQTLSPPVASFQTQNPLTGASQSNFSGTTPGFTNDTNQSNIQNTFVFISDADANEVRSGRFSSLIAITETVKRLFNL